VDWGRAIVAGYVLCMCVVLSVGWKLTRPQGFAAHGAVGVFAGLANAVGMAGLPVATYFTAQSMSAAVFRATLIAYFAILDLLTAPLMWWHGLLTLDTLWAVVLALPIMVLGIWAGGRHFLNTDPQDFRRFAIGLLAALAMASLVKSLL
jgi:uncharacterized protein